MPESYIIFEPTSPDADFYLIQLYYICKVMSNLLYLRFRPSKSLRCAGVRLIVPEGNHVCLCADIRLILLAPDL